MQDFYTIELLGSGHSKNSTCVRVYLYTSFRFCLIRKHEDGGNTPSLDIALVCFPEDDTSSKSYHYSIYAACLLVSSFFLLVTLFVYLSVPELRDLQGKCLMFSMSSLCLAYISLAVLQLHSDNLSNTMCVSQGKDIYHYLGCVIQSVSCIMSQSMSAAMECANGCTSL
jgi:hypothetical protein